MTRRLMLLAVTLLGIPAWAQPTRTSAISSVEDLRIGLTNSSVSLALVRSVRPMASGDVAMIAATARAFEILVVDSLGRKRWSWDFEGRPTPQGLALAGDTIVALTGAGPDAQLLRFVIGTDEPVTAIDIGLTAGRSASLVGSLDGPSYLVSVVSGTPIGRYLRAHERPSYEVLRVDADSLRSVASWQEPMARPVLSARIEGTAATMALPLPWAPMSAVAAGAGNLYYSHDASYGIHVKRSRESKVLHGPDATTAMTDDHLRPWFEHWRNGPIKAYLSDTVERVTWERSRGATRPVVGGLVASTNGDLAVVRSDLRSIPPQSTDSLFVDIFDPSYNWKGRTVLPPGAQVHAFTGTHLFITVAEASKRSGFEREGRPLPAMSIRRLRLDVGR